MTYREKVADFLCQRRIAVAGVSRQPEAGAAANVIYRKLKQAGYQVFAVNPRADTVEGDACFHSLADIPEKPGGLVIVTNPEAAVSLVRECAALGIPRVWMHRSFGAGSVSQQALALGQAKGISVISGGCPMMFCEPVDFPHRCIRWVLKLKGDFKD